MTTSLRKATAAPRSARSHVPPFVARWSEDHGLSITLAVAALARLLHWNAVRRSDPFYDRAPAHFDIHTYCAWGRSIAQGDWLSQSYTQGQPFFYGPVYSYFLGLLFAVFGENYDAVHGVQAMLGVATCALVWVTGRDLFGKPAALAAGLLTALCAPFLFYEQVLLMEGLLIFLHALFLWAIVRTGAASSAVRWKLWMGAGVLAGLVTVARSNFLLLVPLFAVGAWLQEKVLSSTGQSRRAWRAFLPAGGFLMATSLILMLSLGRNVWVSGQWVLTTSNGPMNLYIGNAPDAVGVLELPPSYLRLKQLYGHENAVPWSAELRKALARDPGALPRLFFRKLWLFWNSYDVADNVSYYLAARYSPLIRWSPAAWLFLIPLGLSGAWIVRGSRARQWPLYVYALLFPVTIAMVFVLGRYRLPVLLPLLLWSGVGLSELGARIRAHQWRGVLPHALVMAVGCLLLWPAWSPAVRHYSHSSLGKQLIRPNEYNNFAQGQLDRGRVADARAVLEDGVKAHPRAPELLAKLTRIYMSAGEPERAIEPLQRYLQLNGPAVVPLQYLAEAQAKSGRTADALRTLETLLAIQPSHSSAQQLRQHLLSSANK